MIDERVAKHLREMDIKVAVVGGFDKRATFAEIREIAVLYESILEEKNELIRRYESTSGVLPDSMLSAKLAQMEEASRFDKAYIEQLALEKKQLEEGLALQKQEIARLYAVLQNQQQAPSNLPTGVASAPAVSTVDMAAVDAVPGGLGYPQGVPVSVDPSGVSGVAALQSYDHLSPSETVQFPAQVVRNAFSSSQPSGQLQAVAPSGTSTFEPADALPLNYQSPLPQEASQAPGNTMPAARCEAAGGANPFGAVYQGVVANSPDSAQITIAQPSWGDQSDVAVLSEAARQAQQQDYVQQLSQMESEFQALLQQRLAEEQQAVLQESSINDANQAAGQVVSQPVDQLIGQSASQFAYQPAGAPAVASSQFVPQPESASQIAVNQVISDPQGQESLPVQQVCEEPAIKTEQQIAEEAVRYQAMTQGYSENQNAGGIAPAEVGAIAAVGASMPTSPTPQSANFPTVDASEQQSAFHQSIGDANQRAAVQANAQRIALEKDEMMKELDSARQRLMAVRSRLS